MTQPEGALGDIWSGMAAGKHIKSSCRRRDHSSFERAAVNQPCESPLWKTLDLVHAYQDKQPHSADALTMQY